MIIVYLINVGRIHCTWVNSKVYALFEYHRQGKQMMIIVLVLRVKNDDYQWGWCYHSQWPKHENDHQGLKMKIIIEDDDAITMG